MKLYVVLIKSILGTRQHPLMDQIVWDINSLTLTKFLSAYQADILESKICHTEQVYNKYLGQHY